MSNTTCSAKKDIGNEMVITSEFGENLTFRTFEEVTSFMAGKIDKPGKEKPIFMGQELGLYN